MWGGGGCVNLGVGVMWEGGSGYGACEDRGCGNEGSVQEVSTFSIVSSHATKTALF